MVLISCEFAIRVQANPYSDFTWDLFIKELDSTEVYSTIDSISRHKALVEESRDGFLELVIQFSSCNLCVNEILAHRQTKIALYMVSMVSKVSFEFQQVDKKSACQYHVTASCKWKHRKKKI